MLGDSVKINNVCCNLVVLKKNLVKPLKIAILGPNVHCKGDSMGHTQNEKHFFLAEITKADHQLSKKIFFIKIYVLAEL